MRWEQFFGPGNALRWDRLESVAGADQRTQLQPFLDLVTSGAPVAALPRVQEGTRRLFWYVLWRSDRDTRFAHDLVRAFLGASYSDFGALPPLLDPSDGVEGAVLDAYGGNAFRIEVPPEFREVARGRLLRMAELLRDRPVRTAHRWRAVGRILRDFEFALGQDDPAAAQQCLDELRAGGYLDAVNLAYLDLRRLEALDQWEEVLRHPSLSTVLEIGVPRRVAEALLRAVYHQHLAAFQVDARAEEARDSLREVVLPKYSVLYRTRQGMVGLEVDTSFLLLDAVRGDRNDDAEAIVGRHTADISAHSFLAAIAALLPRPVVPPAPLDRDPMHAAARWFEEGNVDAAFEAASRSAVGVARTRLLLRCAIEMDGDAPLVTALEAFETLPPATRDELWAIDSWRRRIERARGRVGARASRAAPPGAPPLPIASWEAWFSRLREETPWPGAVASAESGGPTWSVDDIASRPDAVTAVHAVIEARLPEWAAEALRGALPAIVKALVPPDADARLQPLVEVLFDLLATEEAVSVPLCTAMVQLARPCLYGGATKRRYSDVLGGLASAAETVATPAVVAAVLEALDLALSVGTPDEDVRRSFGARLAGVLGRWWRRIELADQVLAATLLADLEVPDALPPPRAAGEEGPLATWAGLAGRSVAIYSLNEGALHRASRTLQAMCESTKVSEFHDLVGGSPALREKARTADLFVVVTGAATHAATGFIEAHRGRDRSTVYARGQGSSSIIAAVRDWLVNQVGPPQ